MNSKCFLILRLRLINIISQVESPVREREVVNKPALSDKKQRTVPESSKNLKSPQLEVKTFATTKRSPDVPRKLNFTGTSVHNHEEKTNIVQEANGDGIWCVGLSPKTSQKADKLNIDTTASTAKAGT